MSEDDIVTVFDTAGDTYDDYLRYEALILGARLYPDSTALLERRAIHYLDTDIALFEKFMNDYSGVMTPMMNLLRLNLLENLPYDEIVNGVEAFLGDFKFNDDEEVIQFVQTLHTLNLDRWLVDNLDRLKAMVPYLPTLLYEYAFNADGSNILSEVAVKALEELTEIEPYTADYWTLLSIAHSREGNFEKALSAIDYALAIDPDNIEALKTRMRIASRLDNDKEVNETAWRILALDPEDHETAFILILGGEVDTPEDTIRFIHSLAPSARAYIPIVTKAIVVNYDDLPTLLNELYDKGITNPSDWRELADLAAELERYDFMNTILDVYSERSGAPLEHEYLLFKTMFNLGNYPLAAKIFMESGEGTTLRSAANAYPAWSMFLIALLRMGDTATAENAAKSLLQAIDDEQFPGTPLERKAMHDHLTDILKRIHSKRNTNWNNYPPVGL